MSPVDRYIAKRSCRRWHKGILALIGSDLSFTDMATFDMVMPTRTSVLCLYCAREKLDTPEELLFLTIADEGKLRTM